MWEFLFWAGFLCQNCSFFFYFQPIFGIFTQFHAVSPLFLSVASHTSALSNLFIKLTIDLKALWNPPDLWVIKVVVVFFPQEYDNDAETLVSHLAVTIEDDDLDISKYMLSNQRAFKQRNWFLHDSYYFVALFSGREHTIAGLLCITQLAEWLYIAAEFRHAIGHLPHQRNTVMKCDIIKIFFFACQHFKIMTIF